MAPPRKAWRTRLAPFAALLFALQAMFGLAGTASAAPTLDIFGNPLCITGPSGGPVDHDSGHSRDCCILASGSGFAADTPCGSVLALPGLAERLASARGLRPAPVIAAPDHDPGNPRAPPLAA